MFEYSPEIIEKLIKSLSLDRLSTYGAGSTGCSREALELYIWNTQASAAFYVPLQGLEVTLRNALHRELAKKFGTANWYDTFGLERQGREKVQKAKESVYAVHRKVAAPHVVAELSFGFWQSLLSKRYYQSLWVPALHKAFPNAKRKPTDIQTTLNHLRILRNRIAHHEPIFMRHLSNDYQSILQALTWICPETAKWVEHQSKVDEILMNKPH